MHLFPISSSISHIPMNENARNPDKMVIPSQRGRYIRIDERTYVLLRPGKNADAVISRIEEARRFWVTKKNEEYD